MFDADSAKAARLKREARQQEMREMLAARERAEASRTDTLNRALNRAVATLQRRYEGPSDPAFWDRVSARLDEMHGASTGADAKSKPSARSQWNTAVAKYVAAGWSRSRATSKVNAENPGLRERLIAEANRPQSVERPAARATSRPAARSGATPGGSVRAEWLEAVAAHVATGLTKARAVSRVNSENPRLRERLLAEANR